MKEMLSTEISDALAPASLTLTLLGPIQIAHDGVPLTFAYEKVQALLVFLAVESDRAHRRAALADLLWPDQDESAARHSLSQALFSLRRAIRDHPDNPLVLVTRDNVRLNPATSIWVDVVAFHELLRGASNNTEQLRQASALCRGEFLEGWGIGDSAAFEEWSLLTREQLRGQACDVLRQLTEPHALAGDAAQVCDDARRWIALDPLCEEAYRRLMRALAQRGQRTAALAQFAQCRRVLHDELGIAPEPATVALYEELKQSVAPVPACAAHSSRAALPLPPTRLIDRERELADLAALLADPTNRLITITGPGGVGKTRLALHAAAIQVPAFRDGVCFVPLAPVREPALVLARIAQALGVPQNDTRPLDELVRATLAPRHVLLLLDNCEHLLPAATTLIAGLLAAAPDMVVLTTSRVTLRLSQERRYYLTPLALPDADQAALTPSGAVALFVERAQAARPSVELDYHAIGAICRRLDGLPLAIELAATRTRLLDPRELLARLEQRLPLLSGGPSDLPERQQTMHATIDWSYQLLEPHQQALFRRLAVFACSWTAAAAEAVCANLPDTIPQSASVLDGLAALLDASLISEVTGAGEPRCTMLETIREYARAQLVAHDELAGVQELNARYAMALAAQAAVELNGPRQTAWFQQLDAELDNLRTILSWCVEHAVGDGLRLASDLSRFWDIRGHWREGRAWLEALLRCASDPNTAVPTTEQRAAGLLVAGVLAMFLSDFAPATKYLRESLGLYQQLDDQPNIGRAINNLGNVALYQGAYAEAEQHYWESLMLRREHNHTVGMASSLNNLALATRMQGDLHAAKAYFDQSLTIYSQIGDTASVAFVMGHTATILLLQGAYGEAQHLFEASYVIAQELGHKSVLRQTLSGLGDIARMQQHHRVAKGYYQQSLTLSAEIHDVGAVARNVFCFAVLAWAEQRGERAALLLSAADAMNHRAHTVQAPEDSAEFAQHTAAVRAALRASTFEAAWERGQGMALEQAVALALD